MEWWRRQRTYIREPRLGQDVKLFVVLVVCLCHDLSESSESECCFPINLSKRCQQW